MKCDCDQSFEVHPPGYHDVECSIWGQPYVLNVLTATGRRLPVTVQLDTNMFACRVDQRDGFELTPVPMPMMMHFDELSPELQAAVLRGEKIVWVKLPG